jgi:hypothetical protein
LFASALALAGCSFLTDRREAVAYHTLFDSEGLIDEAAYSAAMSAKFPPGTPLKSVQAYVAANDGDCRDREPNLLWCEIPYRAKFCAVALIGLEVAKSGANVGSMRVVIGGLSC